MSKNLSQISPNSERLSTILLSTLDESVFFCELSRFLADSIDVKNFEAIRVGSDEKLSLISRDGKAHSAEEIQKASSRHVLKTKRAYFSNDIKRDPLFEDLKSDSIERELALPVVQEGLVIATIHFQVKQGEEKEFHREDMTKLLSILKEVEKPLKNMKMYLMAKSLNESLMKKIEMKEKEIH